MVHPGGYGGPGPYAGFQGFGLGYHLGYGYGGWALGVGPDGGYPFYGGPGYPNCDPVLRRCGGIVPFPYFGGPGAPTPDHPNFFGGVGPLVPDQPVVTIGGEYYGAGYGAFTGVVPYPEAVLAPFTTRAGEAGASRGVNPPATSTPSTGPPTPPTSPAPAPGGTPGPNPASSSLGIDAVPTVDAGGVRGLKVSRVHPATAAEKAGLHVGDVIRSINGYVTEQPGHLAWVIAHAAPDHVLKMSARGSRDGEVRTVTARLP
jgi:hypothetical protein